MRAGRYLLAAAAVGLLLVLGGTASGYAPTPVSTWVVSGNNPTDPNFPNPVVYSVAVSGSTAYLGGRFDYVGPPTGSSVAADPVTGAVVAPWPGVSGDVFAVASDGAGGFFIGGLFRSVGPRRASNLAHIKSDGSLDTNWTGTTNGTVYALAVSGTTVYVGGAFSQADGAAHVNLAALTKSTGAEVSNPSFTAGATGTGAFVAALRLDGTATRLYVGGVFSSLAGVPRTNVGAINTATNSIDANWVASANAVVYAIAVDSVAVPPRVPSGNVYIGGAFTTVTGGADRQHAAGFASDGTLLANWDPGPESDVYALDVSPADATVYLGGKFAFVDNEPRGGLAAVTPLSGTASSWDPDTDGQVFAISVAGDGATVYAGGRFNFVNHGVKQRDNLAAFSASGTGTATGFATSVGGDVDAIALSNDGSRVSIGGIFQAAGTGASAPLPVRNLAAIDLNTGAATGWGPVVNNEVDVVAVFNNKIYAGGAFTTAVGANGTKARERLAAFDTSSNVTSWNPAVHDGKVFALTFSGSGTGNGASSTVYAGGSFTKVSCTTATAPCPGANQIVRNSVAAFKADAVDNGFGDLLAWNPNASDTVFALDYDGASTVYLGGAFTSLNGTARNFAGSVGITGGGLLTGWNPNMNNTVFTLAHVGTTEYAGGAFTSVNGNVSRPAAAAFTAGSSTPNSWNPQLRLASTVGGVVYSMAPTASNMYLSGDFRTLGGPWTGPQDNPCQSPCLVTPGVAAVSLTDGAPNRTWAPATDDIVWGLGRSTQGVVIGGQFTATGLPRSGTLPANTDEPAATYRSRFALLRALPDAPTNVTATAGNAFADVTFNAPNYTGGVAIDAYTLTATGGQAPIVMNNVTSPVHVPNLVNGTAYTFSITATTAAGTGEPGVSNAVTPHTVPGAPTNVTAVPDDGRATVSFTPPADNGGDAITQYKVYASTGQTQTGTSSPIVIFGLANDVPVTFTVTATNSTGEGPASSPSDPVTPVEGGRPHPTPPPPAPRPAVPDPPAPSARPAVPPH